MKAIVYKGPGQLELTERPVPSLHPGHVLVKVFYIGVCGTDLLIWKGGLPRIIPPVVLGHEFSGTVVDPNGVAGVSEGDPVVIEPLLSCGTCWACRHGHPHVCRSLRLIGIDVDGAAAEYVSVPAEKLHPTPQGLSLRDAALAEPLSVAVHMVRRSAAGLGDRVIILGGGPIGALVAFVCRDAGVAEVVVSEPNESRRGLLASMGLEALDLGDDLTTVLDRTDGEGFDVVFELAGVEATMLQATDLARVRGTILLGALPGAPLGARVASAVTKEQNLTGSRVYESRDMEHALRILAAGRVPSEELVTREVDLTEAIPRAYEALRTRRDEMKILLTNEG